MLDVLNLYGHGFVAAPTILACRQVGLFAALADAGPLTQAALQDRLQANSGHLAAALRLLQSLGWIDKDGQSLSLAGDWAECQELPGDLLQWWQFPIAEFLDTGHGANDAAAWIEVLRSLPEGKIAIGRSFRSLLIRLRHAIDVGLNEQNDPRPVAEVSHELLELVWVAH